MDRSKGWSVFIDFLTFKTDSTYRASVGKGGPVGHLPFFQG